MNRRFLITGCSGGGKSTLINLLQTQGHTVVPEPGLRVIQNAGPTPWDDLDGFIQAVISLSRNDLLSKTEATGPVFFDRGLFDGVSGLAARRKIPIEELLPDGFPYCEPVFFAAPWPEIFEQTSQRPHSLAVAVEEAERLRADLGQMGIETLELPNVSAQERVRFVLRAIG